MSAATSFDFVLNGERCRLSLELLNKYNVPGPRYTSYPTAPEWSDTFGAADFEAALKEGESAPTRPVSLYFHIPFCQSLCLFCGCNVVINKKREVAFPYLEHLRREIDLVSRRVPRSRPVVQLHWGGGSPTYLSPEQMADLFGYIRERFTFASDAEIGVEVDPRTTTEDHIRTLRRLGFNRMSMGVQDFDPAVQKTVHRIQSYELTKGLVDLGREVGFESVNVDMIYGLPRQTETSFADSVEKVISIQPDRVAMYSYAHVPWLKKQQNSFAKHIPQGVEKFLLFRAGINGFMRAGYEYIGMDHFARPEDELTVAQRERTLHRNFQGYSTRAKADLYGMGVSSISGVGRVYAQNQKVVADYYRVLDEGALPTMRGCTLTDDDVLRREVIGRILCHRVLHKSEIEKEFSIRFDEYFAEEQSALKDLAKDGLLILNGDALTATPLGCIFLRNIAMAFDPYLRRKERGEKQTFSRTL